MTAELFPKRTEKMELVTELNITYSVYNI